ncbi:MAG: glycine cleavage T C-terminal barrel domain-containing protein, partial [Pseudomonadota bacterium]
EYLLSLYEMLMHAGQEFGLRLFGGRALNSLRLEKSFGSWATEYRPIYGPIAARMDRFVDFTKNDFIGRDAALHERDEGPECCLITLCVSATDADVMGDEPIWHKDEVVGWVTSGGYAHYVDQSLALGYVRAECSEKDEFQVEVLGVRCDAKRVPEPLFDANSSRMRG